MFNFLKKKEKQKNEESSILEESEKFHAIAKGVVKSLTDVPDPVFSNKLMGDGYATAIEDGNIYAPISGKLSAVFPTGHAYGIKSSSGVEVLIHIGIDTVSLEGKGFDVKVKQGDMVKRGDLLVTVDLDYLKANNKPTITPLIFTSGETIELLLEGENITNKDVEVFKFI